MASTLPASCVKEPSAVPRSGHAAGGQSVREQRFGARLRQDGHRKIRIGIAGLVLSNGSVLLCCVAPHSM